MSSEKIFLSHSYKDKKSADALYDFFREIGINKENIFCSSVLNAGFPIGTEWFNEIVDKIKKSQIVICLDSMNFLKSPTCQKELGMAIAFEKKISFVSLEENERFDPYLKSIQGFNLNVDSLTNFCDELIAELNLKTINATATRRACKRFLESADDVTQNLNNNNVLVRGDILDDLKIIDATFYLKETDTLDPLPVIQNCVESMDPLPPKMQYITAIGADRWMKLCGDVDYSTYQSSLGFLKMHFKDILGIIGAEYMKISPDYISLGPGDGVKDKMILREMFDFLEGHNIKNLTWFYYPYDISMNLLRSSINTVASSDRVKENLKIKAICADINSLRDFKAVYEYRGEPNIFALLGNTLGNMTTEKSFLQRVHGTMNSDDYFIIEVRLHDGVNKLTAGGSEENRKRFNFSPLEFLGVKYNKSKLKYKFESTAISQISNTKSLVGVYGPYQYNNKNYTTQLCNINFYDMEEIIKVFSITGFDVVWSEANENKTLGLFLLKKTS